MGCLIERLGHEACHDAVNIASCCQSYETFYTFSGMSLEIGEVIQHRWLVSMPENIQQAPSRLIISHLGHGAKLFIQVYSRMPQ